MLPMHLFIALTLLVTVVAVRLVTANRTIHRRLVLAGLLALGYLGIGAVVASGRVGADVVPTLRSIEALLLALGLIVLVVTLAINPLREDRVPDRFPTIVQDAVIVGLFLVVATLVMREKFLTTSAVGAVVVGLALQDTLGNAIAGLAIQVEKPFHVGDWISVSQHEGRVAEVTWRATKLKTKAGNLVVVPNNVMAKEAILNYSEPGLPTRLTVEIGTGYDCPPNRVRGVLEEAVRRAPLVLRTPEPEVIFDRFDAYSLVYKVRFWIDDFALDMRAGDQVRTAIYYALKREGIEIPFPIQVEMHRYDRPADQQARVAGIEVALATVPLFQPLSARERHELAKSVRERMFGAGEFIVRQNEAGASMFIVQSGHVDVTLEPGARRVATIGPGGHFGEMSLLTGEPRSATVVSAVDTAVLEVTAEMFRSVVLANPSIVERVTQVAVARRAELERSRQATSGGTRPAAADASLVERVRRFLRMDR